MKPWTRAWWTPDRRHGALLVLILALVGFVVHEPHLDLFTGQRYDYPVHMDEYVHWGYAQAIIQDGSINFRNPFTGDSGGEFSLENHLHERGYQAYLGVFQSVTGIPWLTLFEWGPVAIGIFLALAVYIIAKPWDAGLESALLVACIPTTLRFLGPGFMVPIVFSLPLVAVGLHALYHTRTGGGLVAFGAIAAGLWPIHVIGAFALFLLGALYALGAAMESTRRALIVGAVVTLPFLAAWGFYSRLLDTGVLIDPSLPSAEGALLLFGIVPLLAAALGAAVLLFRAERDAFAAGISLAAGLCIFQGIILYRLFTDEDPFMLYDRSFMLLFFLGSLLGGIGLAAIAKWARRWTMRAPRPRAGSFPYGIVVAFVITLGATVAASAAPAASQTYYHILSDDQYAAYTAATGELNATYGKAVVEGISTMPFTILTGASTLYVHFPSDSFVDPAPIREFFAHGANDTYFLLANGATVVVTNRTVTNPDLIQVAHGVYVLRWDYAHHVAAADAARAARRTS